MKWAAETRDMVNNMTQSERCFVHAFSQPNRGYQGKGKVGLPAGGLRVDVEHPGPAGRAGLEAVLRLGRPGPGQRAVPRRRR